MNEVSQGTFGSMEYVEFVVVDNTLTYNCSSTTPPTIDIRGWIFDDNSGYHGTGGIAGGAVRFSFNSIWAAVPLGTIILIYNNTSPDPSIPAADLALNDGNCRIIAPISNTTLFESNVTTPGAVACSYPTTGWTAGGNWSNTLLANTGDCARIVNLAGCEVFSVCYGDVNLNTQIYFAAGAELVNDHRNTVYFFNGIDPMQQTNWSIGCTDNETVLDANQCGANFQTPGAPNNAANAAFIGQFNNNCQPITPMVASNIVTNITCNGVSNGSALITASGGIAGYDVSWTGPSSGNPSGIEIASSGGTYNMTGLSVGTYNITVTGAHGCTATTSFTIAQSAGILVSNNSTNVSCNGSSNGSAVITASGGTAGYNVSWTGTTSGNPAGTEIASSGGTYNMTGLVAGTYNITVTDANNCTATTTVTITEPTVLTATNTSTNVSCNTGSNGSAVITASGGTAGYNVSWTGTTTGNPAGTEIAASGGTYNMTGLVAGTYNITVTDANGCTSTTTVTITEPTVLTATNTSTNVSCNAGSNGAAVITASGGTSGYNVSWTGTTSGNPAGTEIAASGGTYNMTGLVAGTYNITVTDANNCASTTTVTITQLTPLNLSITGTFPQSCICNGSASISASGAVGSYTYAWYNSSNININQPTSTASNLCSGSYYCVVTTSSGCSDTITVFVPTTCSSYGTFASATMVENCDTIQFYNSTWGTLPDQINPLGILLNGYNYGPFFQNSGTLILRGGEVKTYKDPGSNVCGAKLHYAVYSATNPPVNPTFTILDLPFKESCNLGSSSFPTGGPCFFPGDQKWAKENYNIDLTNNIPGDYILEVFYAVPGSFSSTNGCTDTIFVNNNGLNYKALFKIEPLPLITPNGPTTFCEGGVVTLTSNYFIGNQWNNGSNLNAIDVGNSDTFTTTIDLGNNCPLASDSEIINVYPLPQLSLIGGGEFCEGDVIDPIIATVSGSPDWTLTYNVNGGASQTINSINSEISLGNSEGTYIVTSLNDNYCSNVLNDTAIITINPIPGLPNVIGGGSFCIGNEIQPLSASGMSGIFNWYTDQNLTQNIATGASYLPIQNLGTSTYWVTETTSGCQGSPTAVDITFLACEITVPTAFTPDGDLTNDYWNIQDIDTYYPENQVFIYNRWGALLYQSEKGSYLSKPWNGKYKDEALPVGSYYYIIETGSDNLKGIVSIILD
jgi:gliding motility-associated-like protein